MTVHSLLDGECPHIRVTNEGLCQHCGHDVLNMSEGFPSWVLPDPDARWRPPETVELLSPEDMLNIDQFDEAVETEQEIAQRERADAFDEIALDRRALLETEGPPPLSIDAEIKHLERLILRKKARRESIITSWAEGHGPEENPRWTFWERLKFLITGNDPIEEESE